MAKASKRQAKDNGESESAQPERLLTVDEVAAILAVSTATISRLIGAGDIVAINISVGRSERRPRYRIYARDLEQFLAARRTPAAYVPPARPTVAKARSNAGEIRFF